MVAKGMEGKTMGANYRHDHSSRSHTVVRLVVESHHETDDKLTGVISGSLMLVDLAGSETVHDNKDAKATGEGKAIIKSLFHLRNCVHALGSGKRPDFRSSKLTRLLEPSIKNGSIFIWQFSQFLAEVVLMLARLLDRLRFADLQLRMRDLQRPADHRCARVRPAGATRAAEPRAEHCRGRLRVSQAQSDDGRRVAGCAVSPPQAITIIITIV